MKDMHKRKAQQIAGLFVFEIGISNRMLLKNLHRM
jgi:hypothetical protein